MTSTQVRGACPHDCPDTCALLVDGRGRRGDRRHGRPGPPDHGRRAVHEGGALPRAHLPRRPPAVSDAPGRPKGEGRFERISWDEALGDDRRALRRDRRARRPQAILPYSYAGTMGLLQGESMDRRFFHRLGASLLDRTICATAGKAGCDVHARRARSAWTSSSSQDAKLIVIWGSNPIASNLHFWSACRRPSARGARLVAIDPYRSADGREVPPAHRAAARHRRRAGARPDARADRATDLRRPRLHRRATRSASTQLADARRRVDAGARRPRSAASRSTIVALARDYGTHAAPAAIRAQLRHAARARRRHGGARRSPACRRWSAPGAIRPAACCCPSSGTLPDRHARRCERPDLHRRRTPRTINMTHDRRRAAPTLPRSAGRGARSSTTPTRSRSRPTREGDARASRARICSPSCTSISRPTPPTTPTSCCRPRRSSSTSTCTARTATST